MMLFLIGYYNGTSYKIIKHILFLLMIQPTISASSISLDHLFRQLGCGRNSPCLHVRLFNAEGESNCHGNMQMEFL